MSKALRIEQFKERVWHLEDDVDRFKYNHSLLEPVPKHLADAINLLTEARLKLKEAFADQALQDLRMREEENVEPTSQGDAGAEGAHQA